MPAAGPDGHQIVAEKSAVPDDFGGTVISVILAVQGFQPPPPGSYRGGSGGSGILCHAHVLSHMSEMGGAGLSAL
jgi:hypothetical protein